MNSRLGFVRGRTAAPEMLDEWAESSFLLFRACPRSRGGHHVDAAVPGRAGRPVPGNTLYFT